MIRPLAEVFGELNDPRQRQGKWHDMGTTLTMIFLAILSGEQGIRGVSGWIQEQRWRLGRQFKLKNSRVPSYGTIRRVLATVAVSDLERCLSKWANEIGQAWSGEAWPGIAIDGKTLRGSGDEEHPALHLLSAFSHELGVVLIQRAVGSKTNEIPEARRLLEDLTLEGKLVTVDALHTQRDTAQAIVEKKGAYLMTVKENQPRLLADLTTFFSRKPGPGQDLRCIQDTTKAHGRLETRTLWASADVKPYLDWPAAQQALCLERRVIRLSTGEISTEVVYGITCLTPDQLDLAKVLARWRGHWGIENREHWVRDVIMAEDTCRVHQTARAQVLAALRNAVISLCRALGRQNIKDARRHFALNLDQAFAFVCGSLE